MQRADRALGALRTRFMWIGKYRLPPVKARMRRPLSIVVALLAGAPHAGAQLPERRLPTTPAAVAEEPFSELRSVRELSDGRIIVLDMRDQTIQVIDFPKGDAAAVGRRGQGPGEYARAMTLMPWPGDSTALVDGGAGRLLLIGPDAKPGRVITALGQGGEVSPRSVRAADAVGRVYVGVLGTPVKSGEFVPPDSMRVQRVDVRTGQVTPLGSVALPKSEIKVSGSRGKVSSVEIMREPFAVGDEWDVASDGRVAIVRRDGYRLDQIMSDGRVVRGPTIGAASLKVTEADRKEYLASVPNAAAARAPGFQWPATRPPFPTRAVVALASGETWVLRNQPPGARTMMYDVFGVAGRPIARLILSADRRIISATARWIYVARTDSDGLQYLERYPTR